MANISELTKRMQNKYQPVPVPKPTLKEVKPEPVSVASEPVTVVSHSGHRGRPKGSRTRQEEVCRVGFEVDMSLLKQFDDIVQKKGLSRRQAYHEALRCFVSANK